MGQSWYQRQRNRGKFLHLLYLLVYPTRFRVYNCYIFYELENQIAEFSERGKVDVIGDFIDC